VLLAVDDPIKRKSLETRAIQKKLSSRELRTLILKKFPKTSSDLSKDEDNYLLKIPDLKLYTYKTSTPIPNNTPLLDLGFSIFTSLPSKVRQSKITTITDKPQYTYKAFLKKVIDGDTIEVVIDLGFSNYTTQRLRLNSIDTPELPSREGLKAKKFIEKTLKDVSFIIIKTHSHDKYDRYLVDVFFLEGNAKEEDVLRNGRFLNQEILDAGMGWRW
jgi:micrococcal nuclease